MKALVLRWVCCTLACWAALAHAYSEEDEPWREAETALPIAPRDADLIEFEVGSGTTNRFFVDGGTLQVGPDGVIRFVLLVRSESGTRNVTFEGLRCANRTQKLYAIGRPDGSWLEVRRDWQPVRDNQLNRHHSVLTRHYFCDPSRSIENAAAARAVLRRGGNY